MLNPETSKKKLKNCCKNGNNLSYCYGDAVEFEVYKCDKCNNEQYVQIEIQRFWSGAEYVKKEVN